MPNLDLSRLRVGCAALCSCLFVTAGWSQPRADSSPFVLVNNPTLIVDPASSTASGWLHVRNNTSVTQAVSFGFGAARSIGWGTPAVDAA